MGCTKIYYRMAALNPKEVKVVQETWAEVATDPYELTELGVTFFIRYTHYYLSTVKRFNKGIKSSYQNEQYCTPPPEQTMTASSHGLVCCIQHWTVNYKRNIHLVEFTYKCLPSITLIYLQSQRNALVDSSVLDFHVDIVKLTILKHLFHLYLGGCRWNASFQYEPCLHPGVWVN